MSRHNKTQKKKKRTPETDHEFKLFWPVYKPHNTRDSSNRTGSAAPMITIPQNNRPLTKQPPISDTNMILQHVYEAAYADRKSVV